MTTPAPAPQPTYTAPIATGQKTNVLAIVSLVTSIIGFSLVGVICGHIGLNQINRTGENGRGLAIAGLIIGYVGIALSIIAIVVFIPLMMAATTVSINS